MYYVTIIGPNDAIGMETHEFSSRQEAVDFAEIVLQTNLFFLTRIEILDERTIYIQ